MPNYRKLVGDALQAATGIRAFHASPHDFDKFDISKIGTGQGAASYGKGIYAAENPAVSGPGGEYWQEFARRTPVGSPEYFAQETLRAADFDRAKALEEAHQLVELSRGVRSRPEDKQYFLNQTEARKRAAEILADPTKQAGPRVYELNINAPRQDFLNWDKPLAGQSAVKKFPALLDAAQREASDRALASTGSARQTELYNMAKNPEQAPGEFAYRGILPSYMRGTHRIEAQENAMRKMADLGIPGIEYLDQGSRQAGRDLIGAQRAVTDIERQGRVGTPEHRSWLEQLAKLQQAPTTSNFVLHRDDIIDILKKYGITAPAAGVVANQAQYLQQPEAQ